MLHVTNVTENWEFDGKSEFISHDVAVRNLGVATQKIRRHSLLKSLSRT
jgi:hypothetical protein